jgi:hypothetical protein
MSHIDLLGNLNGESRLNFFAMKFFAVIDASQVEERESSNYVDGRYFRGSVGDVIFTVSLADLDGNEDLPFWIHVKSGALDSESLDSMINGIIHNKVMPGGFHFARMLNFGMRGERRVDYI